MTIALVRLVPAALALVALSAGSARAAEREAAIVGAAVAIAAGPRGRQAAAATDAQLKAEIYSYSRSRGLFGGVSFEGAGLFIDGHANGWFYGRRGATPAEIVTNNGVLVPEVALKL